MKKIINPDDKELKIVLQRPQLEQKDLSYTVSTIFNRIEKEGDKAVKEYALKFDGVTLDSLLVTTKEVNQAKEQVSHELKSAILRAAENITAFHEAQKEPVKKVETFPGVFCWRKSVGIDKVGLYIPGGTAPLFSTVLMLGIPAKIAKCKEVVLCTPTNSNGEVNPAILYAADLVGITNIFKIGGIQAIAAMTLGTESVPAVYKIFGPGNQYVTAAKQYAQQLGKAIDMPAGPSEVMVVADNSATPKFIAADLLSQAEHGVDSQVVFVTNEEQMLDQVAFEVEKQLSVLPRKDLAAQSLEYAKLICVGENKILELINEYAPEHLILNTTFNDMLLEGITNAGSVFIGEYTPESLGDYASGTNHTLPTNGFAKMYSGVSLDSFVKKITYQSASAEGLQKLGPVVEVMARAEQLDAHKNAVSIRLNALGNEKN
ncbi:MAG: histidinol dehydrogenase [Fluviicola sp.]|nr:MAG: histidinol dehydrogenase [Fluviicola sp.]